MLSSWTLAGFIGLAIAAPAAPAVTHSAAIASTLTTKLNNDIPFFPLGDNTFTSSGSSDTVPTQESPVITTSPSEQSGTPSSNDACASIHHLTARQSMALPTIPATMAYDCMTSVPFNQEGASRLLERLEPYLQWQTTLQWVKNPPGPYASNVREAYDFWATFDQIKSNVSSKAFQNEYEFELALFKSVLNVHDGHFVYIPTLLTVFNFWRMAILISVTDAAQPKQVPQIYHYQDIFKTQELRANYTPSAVSQINDQDATQFLEGLAEMSPLQDLDAAWNGLFWSYAQVYQGDVSTGAGTFAGGGMGTYIYPGPSTKLTFKNSTSHTDDNFAIVNSDFSNINSGADLYKRLLAPNWIDHGTLFQPTSSPDKVNSTRIPTNTVNGTSRATAPTDPDNVVGSLISNLGSLISAPVTEQFHTLSFDSVTQGVIPSAILSLGGVGSILSGIGSEVGSAVSAAVTDVSSIAQFASSTPASDGNAARRVRDIAYNPVSASQTAASSFVSQATKKASPCKAVRPAMKDTAGSSNTTSEPYRHNQAVNASGAYPQHANSTSAAGPAAAAAAATSAADAAAAAGNPFLDALGVTEGDLLNLAKLIANPEALSILMTGYPVAVIGGDPHGQAPGQAPTTNTSSAPQSATGTGSNTGYFLQDANLQDVAVLAIKDFTGPNNSYSETAQTFQQVNANFLKAATLAKKTKLIIDLSGNLGGEVLLAYDLFKQLFPTQTPSALTRWRAHEALNLLGQGASVELQNNSKIWNDRVSDSGNVKIAEEQVWSYRQGDDQNGQPFTSWVQKFGPHPSGPGLDNYTSLIQTNLSDPLQWAQTSNDGVGGIIVTGYGPDSGKAAAAQPFAAENIILVYDGTCASTCALFSHLMTQQAGVKTVAMGGRLNTLPIQAVGGTKGGQVEGLEDMYQVLASVRDVTPPVIRNAWSRTILGNYTALPFLNGNSVASVNAADVIGSGDSLQVPLQFEYKLADCRMFFTNRMATDQANVWNAVAVTAWNGADRCVTGSLSGNSTSPAQGNPKTSNSSLEAVDPFKHRKRGSGSDFDFALPKRQLTTQNGTVPTPQQLAAAVDMLNGYTFHTGNVKLRGPGFAVA